MDIIQRQQFLRQLGGAALMPLAYRLETFAAMDKRDLIAPFHWARIKFDVTDKSPDRWDSFPQGDMAFLENLDLYSHLNVDRRWHAAPLDDLDEMVKYPFLFMTSEGPMEFTPKQQKNFEQYLRRGGFIFADDCVQKIGKERVHASLFFEDLASKVEKLFGKDLVRLPNDHDLYRSYYDMDSGLPHIQGVNHGGHALFLDGRMAMFLSPSDIHCGWESDRRLKKYGRGWFPKEKGELSLQMAVNIVTYAMTH